MADFYRHLEGRHDPSQKEFPWAHYNKQGFEYNDGLT